MKNHVLTLAGLFVLLISCVPQPTELQPTVNQEIPAPKQAFTFDQGMLQFESFVAFKAYYRQISQDTNQIWLADLQRKFPDFVSVYEAFENTEAGSVDPKNTPYLVVLQDESGEKEVRPILEGNMAHLVSRDGRMLIGDHVYEFDYDQNHAFPKTAYLEALSSPNLNLPTASESYPIQRDPQKTYAYSCDTKYNNNKRRVKGYATVVTYQYNGTDYVDEVNASTNHQKKFLGLWWGQKTDVKVYIQIYDPFPISQGAVAYNKSSISHTWHVLESNGFVTYAQTRHEAEKTVGSGWVTCGY